VRDGVTGPEWVRVEIRELRSKGENYHLWVEERNDAGDVLAMCQAKIWKSVSAKVNAKFRDATGDNLRHDIKVLFLVRARFEPLFGFALSVEDVDPSYTLGDLAAKLNKIRSTLQAEEVFEWNRSLPPPVD
jgi:exodeoxyribonuclease VII large subunit